MRNGGGYYIFKANVGIKGSGNGAGFGADGGGLGMNAIAGAVVGVGSGYVLVADVDEATLAIVGPIGEFGAAIPSF